MDEGNQGLVNEKYMSNWRGNLKGKQAVLIRKQERLKMNIQINEFEKEQQR